MHIVPSTTSADEPPPADQSAAPLAVPLVAPRRAVRSTRETERPIPTVAEPRAIAPLAPAAPVAPALPRWIEPERDYRSPTPIERARLLRAAYEASVADAEQRLLIAELMAHYRAWCLRHGKGDPFAGLSRD